MSYGYRRPDPKESFERWLNLQSELISLAVQKGYTQEQAIELLKVLQLATIADNTGMIG